MSSFLERLADWQVANIPALIALLDTRLYPVEAPQGVALPFGVFTQISADEDIHHGGPSGWGSMRVQYEFYGHRFLQPHDAARALRKAFEGRAFEIAGGTQICFCRVESEFDAYESGEGIYRRSLDLLFEYTITQ